MKGATRAARDPVTGKSDFNPRSREGSDLQLVLAVVRDGISIHAPVKGATLLLFMLFAQCFNFNPRSREGSDPFCRGGQILDEISIHAPVKGATYAAGIGC